MTDSPDTPAAAEATSAPAPDGGSGASAVAALADAFGDVAFSTVEPRFGPVQDVAVVARDRLVEFAAKARELGFVMFVDLCGVDYLRRDPRFEVVVNLLALDPPARLRIRVPVPAADPSVPTLSGVYPGANFYEREAYDLFGIDFPGHPDLTRILLPDDWEGHPLRKDYAVGSVPVQFKGAHKAT
jgi:NADH-quinone oxidoreductase subunit C